MPQVERLTATELVFARRMKEERQKRGWTQERLANELERKHGISLHPTAIARMERGDGSRHVPLPEAVAIASLFNTGVDDLLERSATGIDLDKAVSALADVLELIATGHQRIRDLHKRYQGLEEVARKVSSKNEDRELAQKFLSLFRIASDLDRRLTASKLYDGGTK